MADNTIKFNLRIGAFGMEVPVRISESLKELQNNLSDVKTRSEKARASLISWNQITTAIQNVHAGLSQLAGVMHEMTEAYGIQEEAELKLETVMRQRMGATDDMVDSIKRLASAQQAKGVIGDEIQLAGAQQVATFLKEKSSIEKLLPAMNNLAVQRKGLNVTSEDMVNIGNLVGKVMQGNVGALTRVGITFSDTQKQMLKFGDESQRAAILAQVITDNVGNMNEELAKTDAGKAKQMANDFGDMQESIGRFFSKYETLLQGFTQLGIIATGLSTVSTALVGLAKAIGITTVSSKALNAVWAWGTRNIPILKLAIVEYTAAQELEGKGAVAAAASTTLFQVALKGLLIATGVGAAIVALTTILGALSDSSNRTAKTIDNANDSMSETTDVAAEARDQISSQVAAYNQAILKTKDFKGTKQEEKSIVADLNSTYGDTLGVYSSVSEWYSVLTNNSKAYTDQLLNQAKMQILANRAAKNELALEELEKNHPNLKGGKARIGGKDVNIDTNRNQFNDHSDRPSNGQKLGLDPKNIEVSKGSDGKFELTDVEKQHQALSKAVDDDKQEMERLQKDQGNIKIQRGPDAGSSGNSDKGGNSGKGGSTGNTGNNTVYPKGSITELNQQLDALRKKRDSLTDPEKIADVDDEIKNVKDDIDSLNMSASQIGLNRSMKAIGVDKFDANNLGSIVPKMEVPKINDIVFSKSLDDLQKEADDSFREIAAQAKADSEEAAKSMAEAMQNIRSSLGGDVTQTIEEWKQLGKCFKDGGDAATGAGGAMVLAGQAMQQIAGDGAAAKIGAIMAAIGQLVLGYATATAQAAGLGPFGWIGFAIAGAATLASIIAQVSSFSTGGIVGGSSYHGDKVPARVNSGEMILTMLQQKRLFDIANGMAVPQLPVVSPGTSQLSGMLSQPVIDVSIGGEVQGTALKMVLRNTEKKYGKVGKKWS